jgi:hypothetical protein
VRLYTSKLFKKGRIAKESTRLDFNISQGISKFRHTKEHNAYYRKLRAKRRWRPVFGTTQQGTHVVCVCVCVRAPVSVGMDKCVCELWACVCVLYAGVAIPQNRYKTDANSRKGACLYCPCDKVYHPFSYVTYNDEASARDCMLLSVDCVSSSCYECAVGKFEGDHGMYVCVCVNMSMCVCVYMYVCTLSVCVSLHHLSLLHTHALSSTQSSGKIFL